MRYVETESGAVEVELTGGDVTEGLVRIGATVRRPVGPHSRATQHFLRHLEDRGFEGAPRFLGIDARGREVLTFIEGEMAGRPLHPWAGEDAVLERIARLQRRLHDCAEDVVLPPDISWPSPPEIEGAPAPYDVADIIGHNDITPENAIFRDGRPVAFIDFDLAGPSTRLLDVVTTIRYWAPLTPPADRDPVLRDVDAAARMRRFADAYGLDGAQRAQLLDVADRRFTRSWFAMRHAAEHRGGGWARMWANGAGDFIRRCHQWLRDNRAELSAALLD